VQHHGINNAIEHALKAIEIVHTAKDSNQEDLTHNPVYFNARVAVMKSYHASGDIEKASQWAGDIQDEYQKIQIVVPNKLILMQLNIF
tara:strand:+ start:1539 stop:1802 length:264 start_codon:yes stop_codon:yes gene_type:complete